MNDDNKRSQIDEILHQMAVVFANTGKDSTYEEFKYALRTEQELMDKIKAIDPSFENLIRPYGRQEY